MVAVSVAAGSGLIFTRLAYSGGTNALTLQFFRFALVIALLLGWFAWRGQPWRLAGSTLWKTLGLGLLHGFSSFMYVASLRYIPVSLAVIIVYTYPPLVSLLSHWLGDEDLTWRRVVALLLAFCGLAAALELTLEGLDVRGVAMALATSISFAFTLVISARIMRQVPPAVVQFHIAAVNLAVLGLIGLAVSAMVLPATALGWVGLVGMALTFLFAFVGFGVSVHLLGPFHSAILNNLEPVVAVLLSIVLLREALGPWQVLGGGLVLAGMILAR